jgi:glycosyltransferase involved in cell wall biosynthesis
VHFLGRRPYDCLPAYGKQFDVSIIPYRLCPFTLHANPIKLREYLALGKPVVSVSTPAVKKYADVVEIAQSRNDFLAKLDAALTRPPSPAETRRRLNRVASESWEARLGEILRIIDNHLAPPCKQLEFSETS